METVLPAASLLTLTTKSLVLTHVLCVDTTDKNKYLYIFLEHLIYLVCHVHRGSSLVASDHETVDQLLLEIVEGFLSSFWAYFQMVYDWQSLADHRCRPTPGAPWASDCRARRQRCQDYCTRFSS